MRVLEMFFTEDEITTLSGNFFERGSLIAEKDIGSLLPAWDWFEKFASPQEFEDFKCLEVEYTKAALSFGSYLSANIIERQKEAVRLSEQTGSFCDYSLSSLERKLKWFRHDKPSEYQMAARQIEKDIGSRQCEEFDKLVCGKFFVSEQPLNKKEMFKLYRDIAESELGGYGFNVDSSLSKRGFPVYAKKVRDDHSLACLVDSQSLTRNLGDVNLKQELNVEVHFLTNAQPKQKPVNSKIIEMQRLFPLFCPVIEPLYWKFGSHTELALYLLIKIKMFKAFVYEVEELILKRAE